MPVIGPTLVMTSPVLASSVSATVPKGRVVWTAESGEDACWDPTFDSGEGGWVVGSCNGCKQVRMQNKIKAAIEKGAVHRPRERHIQACSSPPL